MSIDEVGWRETTTHSTVLAECDLMPPTSPQILSTIDDVRAWAVDVIAFSIERVNGANDPGPRIMFDPPTTRQPLGYLRSKEVGVSRSVAGAVQAALAAAWPLGRNGGRNQLTALGVYTLLAGRDRAEGARTEAKTLASIEIARGGREGDLWHVLEVWESPLDAERRRRWAGEPHPELAGRSPLEMARESTDGLAQVLPLAEAHVAAERRRVAAGWRLEIEPDMLERVAPGGHFCHADLRRCTFVAHLYDRSELSGIWEFVGGCQRALEGRSRLHWLGDYAARARLETAAAAYLAMRPDDFADPRGRDPVEEFVCVHLLRDAVNAAVAKPPS